MDTTIENFLKNLKEWAKQRSDIYALALVGSYARGTAKPDSDIDILLIVENPDRYLENSTWVKHFGTIQSIEDEDWGLVQSKRVRYADSKEVEFNITTSEWTNINPIDPGTARIVAHGMRVLYDPKAILKSVLAAI